MKFGLANIQALCAALDNPQNAFPSVHIAGTNGKGSVTAMVAAALGAAGHRTARYTSPHLQRVEERFVIDGKEVDPAVLEASAARVQHAAEALVASGTLESLPTFFECTTAVAFDLFREARVDVAVLEVGLGGRLDSTNVVFPIAAAIVSIDFDHQAQLGDTLTAIAAEKAGIIKPGIPVVVGPMPAEALAVMATVCAEQGATLIRTDADVELASRVAAMPLALPGEHQKANAGVAVRLLEAIGRVAPALRTGEDSIRAGLTGTVWPGRLETFTRGTCRLLLDAAHNPAGARALASYVRATEAEGVTLVFGAMQDKAVVDMLTALAPVTTSVVCATAPSPRAMRAETLAGVASSLGLKADAVDDPVEAVQRACGTGRLVLVAGSIFLIGPVREWLARDILR
jgi:dihydrofolate synthase/folylpolyglutamate synthase